MFSIYIEVMLRIITTNAAVVAVVCVSTLPVIKLH